MGLYVWMTVCTEWNNVGSLWIVNQMLTLCQNTNMPICFWHSLLMTAWMELESLAECKEPVGFPSPVVPSIEVVWLPCQAVEHDWKTNGLFSLLPSSRNASPSNATSSFTCVPRACHGERLQASSKWIHRIPERGLEVLFGDGARVWHVWGLSSTYSPKVKLMRSLCRRK